MQPPVASVLSRRSFLVGGAVAATAPLLLRVPGAFAGTDDEGSINAFGFPEPDMTGRYTKDITFPVAGSVSWTDTYGACRDGCTRRHEGQDLIGSKLQKLVACVDGTIVSLKYGSTGNALYLRSDSDGWYYAYLHINNDSPGTDDGANPYGWAFASGIAQGVRVRRGQHIAYLGDSGNAEATVPHLHFEIRKPAPSVWDAQAVNPKYSLDAAKPPPATVPPSTFAPWDNATALIRQQYSDFEGRYPDADLLAVRRQQLETGERSPGWLIGALLDGGICQAQAGLVARLYLGFFRRTGDIGNFLTWVDRIRYGVTAVSVADAFAGSAEFRRLYGDLSNAPYVDRVFRNVLGRAPSPEELMYWTDRLNRGLVSRGGLMLNFSEAPINRAKLRTRVQVTLLFALMVRRMPTTAEMDDWVGRLDGGTSNEWLSGFLRGSAAYKQRFF